ncbi:sulfite exporter TauE/SafE family protein [Candidatus Pacearchaeota archaeon]|nr:MAG: sulfite exporter TauE/SafE family protein [Candidatus Pacearchaeota archaeon]
MNKLLARLLEKEIYFVLAVAVLWEVLILSIVDKGASYWLQFWWMFPIALAIATIVNTVGISGAALFVPFFVLIFPLLAGQPLAGEQSVKLGLITESFGLSSSALAFLRYGLIDKKLGVKAVLVAVPFVIAGAVLSFFLPQYAFYFIIAFALLFSVYLMLSTERKLSKEECIKKMSVGKHHTHPNAENVTLKDRDGKEYKYCRACGVKPRSVGYGVGGFFQGVGGFGIGELGIVSMLLTKIPIRVAIGTSHMVVAMTAIVASLTHIITSNLESVPTAWNILAMTVPAVLAGGQIAPYLAARFKTDALEHFVAGLFIILAVALTIVGITKL